MKITKTVEDTHEFAASIAEKIKDGGVICLTGDLGSGKTTFSKGVAKYLGIDQMDIKSPTYTYISKYGQNFYHIDLYRIEEIDELMESELNEIFENHKNIVIIEWADKLHNLMPKDSIKIEIKYVSEKERAFNLKQ